MEESVIIKTPLGYTEITGNEKGVSKIHVFDHEMIVHDEVPKTLLKATLQLKEYFEGNRIQFDFQLNPKGTEFQKKVWQELLNIPFGKTVSYQELSKKLGNVKAIRAVANANGKNPLWIVVPCHRVIGTDGSLTGYSGGLWRKKWLLNHENIIKQQSLF